MKRQMIWISGILAALVLGSLIAWAGSQQGAQVGGFPLFMLCVVTAFLVQWAGFVPAFIFQTEKYFDLMGSVTYITLTIVALSLGGADDLRSLVIGVCVIIWAARLGSFLFRRISKDGEDKRFRSIKPDFLQFLMTWTLQGLWVSVTFAAGLAAMTSSVTTGTDVFLVAGLALWVVGFIVEVVADTQKSRFRADEANRNKFITSGLWAWSRHPNYFGEITLWLGIAVMALPALQGWQLLCLISPVFVVVLLTRISGVRMLEHRAKKQWGEDPAYQAYKASTPMLLPRPPR